MPQQHAMQHDVAISYYVMTGQQFQLVLLKQKINHKCKQTTLISVAKGARRMPNGANQFDSNVTLRHNNIASATVDESFPATPCSSIFSYQFLISLQCGTAAVAHHATWCRHMSWQVSSSFSLKSVFVGTSNEPYLSTLSWSHESKAEAWTVH